MIVEEGIDILLRHTHIADLYFQPLEHNDRALGYGGLAFDRVR